MRNGHVAELEIFFNRPPPMSMKRKPSLAWRRDPGRYSAFEHRCRRRLWFADCGQRRRLSAMRPSAGNEVTPDPLVWVRTITESGSAAGEPSGRRLKPRRSSRGWHGSLRETLALELNPDKTLITHARTGAARFLGHQITVCRRSDRRERDPRKIADLAKGPLRGKRDQLAEALDRTMFDSHHGVYRADGCWTRLRSWTSGSPRWKTRPSRRWPRWKESWARTRTETGGLTFGHQPGLAGAGRGAPAGRDPRHQLDGWPS